MFVPGLAPPGPRPRRRVQHGARDAGDVRLLRRRPCERRARDGERRHRPARGRERAEPHRPRPPRPARPLADDDHDQVRAGARLSATEPERAAQEIAEVEQLSRRALTEVRAAVARAHDVTLASELASAREVLRASNLVADFPRAIDLVDPDCLEVFGWVVRESVTNVVRYARATTARSSSAHGRSRSLDDGIGRSADACPPGDGHGLIGLRERVEAQGGTLEAVRGRSAAGGCARRWPRGPRVPLRRGRADVVAGAPTPRLPGERIDAPAARRRPDARA